MLSVKQGVLHKGGNECVKQKRIVEVERQKADEREADRERKRERARLKASRPLIRVLIINDNGLWINDFI